MLQHGMMDLIYLKYLIQFQTFTIILSLSLKKHKTLKENPPVKIYVNRIKNKIVLEKRRKSRI